MDAKNENTRIRYSSHYAYIDVNNYFTLSRKRNRSANVGLRAISPRNTSDGNRMDTHLYWSGNLTKQLKDWTVSLYAYVGTFLQDHSVSKRQTSNNDAQSRK